DRSVVVPLPTKSDYRWNNVVRRQQTQNLCAICGTEIGAMYSHKSYHIKSTVQLLIGTMTAVFSDKDSSPATNSTHIPSKLKAMGAHYLSPRPAEWRAKVKQLGFCQQRALNSKCKSGKIEKDVHSLSLPYV
ncbi:5020_t:CDS:2, partial [Ambispora gerdemannii]